MQSQSTSANTQRASSRSLSRDHQSFNGELVAKTFKFYRRQYDPHVNPNVPVKLIPVKSFYLKNKALFDKFADIANKNMFDVDGYMKYCVRCGIKESNVAVCLSSTTMIDKFFLHMKVVNRRKKIYKWFIKSAKNIAQQCIDEGYDSTKAYLVDLIKSGKIANYVSAGTISLYFFAAIPKFDKVIKELDMFSKQALYLLDEHFDVYHSEVNKAFLQAKNIKVNPIQFTDRLIEKMRQ